MDASVHRSLAAGLDSLGKQSQGRPQSHCDHPRRCACAQLVPSRCPPEEDRLSVSKSLIELNGQSGEAGARGTASGWQSSQQLTHLLGGMALGAAKASRDSCFSPLGFGQAHSPIGVARGLERVRGHVGDGHGVPGRARCGRRRRRRDLASGRNAPAPRAHGRPRYEDHSVRRPGHP